MSSEAEFKRSDSSGKEAHQHKGRFTEGLLDSERILKALNIKAGQTILDAGCGNGYMSKLFSKEVAQFGKVYALSFELSVLGGYSLEMLWARDGSRSSFLAKFRYFDVMARTASCSA